MSELTEIILRVLWRFYPIAWLTTTIVRGLSRITSWLEDEESWFQLSCSPEDCAFVGGWLALAEERLNELIVMKAMKLLQRPHYPPRPCGHHIVRAVGTPQEIYRRLCRLIALYHDHKRLYELRAQKLQRLFAQAELQLEAIHHPCQTQPCQMQPSAAASAGGGGGGSDGGGDECHRAAPHPAQPIRAPPWLVRKNTNATSHCLAHPARDRGPAPLSTISSPHLDAARPCLSRTPAPASANTKQATLRGIDS